MVRSERWRELFITPVAVLALVVISIIALCFGDVFAAEEEE